MSQDKIVALLADGAPPARDLAFEVAVMARIEKRAFRRGLAVNVALALAGAALLALVMPPVMQRIEGPWLASLTALFGNALIAVTLGAASLALQWSMTRRV